MLRPKILASLLLLAILMTGAATSSSAQEVDAGINRPTALALDLSNGKMYWSNIASARVLRANLDGTGSEIVVCNFRCAGQIPVLQNFNVAEGMAIDTRTDQVFWTDTVSGTIWRANLDGTDAVNILCPEDSCDGDEGFEDSTLREPLSLAIDANRGKLYWTDGGSDLIKRANLDGTEIESLVCREPCDDGNPFTGIERPVGMALDQVEGKIYWTEVLTSQIQRADFDGTNAETIICRSDCDGQTVDGFQRPTGIAVDSDNGKLYWSDQFTGRIQRSNLDGSGFENVLCPEECEGGVVLGELDSPRGIAIDDEAGQIYWLEGDNNEVWRANLDGTEAELLLCMAGC